MKTLGKATSHREDEKDAKKFYWAFFAVFPPLR
jgi:hypothetical protein